ncbi:YcaO-like family protein [Amycolatopsis sp. NPDC059657]|uniref:YcaO-like family protein n=1 Tax=Amycolatopsis sp. NPDC059657 TaxID=3346899 RepID=UPI00366E9EDE
MRPYLERSREAGLETLLFDATTDFGVPAFFGLQLADHDHLLAQVVATTAGLAPSAAVAKIHRELAMLRSALRASAPEDGAEVLAVDITPREARAAGAVVVKVLVPQAMPIAFGTQARLLGTPRLYTAPAAMNHPVQPESRLNQLPQPMA